jgi:hypothetical protein
MRPIPVAAVIIGAQTVLASNGAMAQYDPRAPALAARFDAAAHYAPWFFRSRRAHVPSARKKSGDTKRASTVRPAVTTGISTTRSSPSARTSIPLPDQALLTPPPEFGCEFRTARPDDASGQPLRPTPAEADRGADAALRMKLDYERQCYQHAEMILRDRLRRLQTAVDETIKAVDRSERPAASTGLSARPGAKTFIPRPDQALMTPPAEFNCEFRTTSRDDASGQPQSRPAPAQADRGTEAALRMKLDYERQCYQHAEMILRDRLRRLQAAIGETIKAAKR